jgi:predicted glycosyltransferase
MNIKELSYECASKIERLSQQERQQLFDFIEYYDDTSFELYKEHYENLFNLKSYKSTEEYEEAINTYKDLLIVYGYCAITNVLTKMDCLQAIDKQGKVQYFQCDKYLASILLSLND